MKRFVLEAARKIELSHSVDLVWQHFLTCLAEVEIDQALYMTVADAPPRDVFVLSTLPDAWPRPEFDRPDFVEPFLAHCCATFEVSKAGVAFLSDHIGYLADPMQDYIRQMAAHDFRAALGIPCRLVGTGRHGGFIIGNNLDAFHFERQILPLQSDLQSLCLIAHRRIEAFQAKDAETLERKPLSGREHETLTYIAKGLRPKQVAGVMDISEASVRLYLRNARAKLGATNKDEAIAIFIRDIAR